ncbi:hypothetical protein Droror1_Dr00014797 [Drosera rotundifolia]
MKRSKGVGRYFPNYGSFCVFIHLFGTCFCGSLCLYSLKNAWPKTLQVLQVLKEQGLILAVLLGLSAFFSMAETSITIFWPWKLSSPISFPAPAPSPISCEFETSGTTFNVTDYGAYGDGQTDDYGAFL